MNGSGKSQGKTPGFLFLPGKSRSRNVDHGCILEKLKGSLEPCKGKSRLGLGLYTALSSETNRCLGWGAFTRAPVTWQGTLESIVLSA